MSFLTSNTVVRKESALNYLYLSVNKLKTVGFFLLKAFMGVGLTLCLGWGRKLITQFEVSCFSHEIFASYPLSLIVEFNILSSSKNT